VQLPLPSTSAAFGALNSVVRPAVRAGFANPWPIGSGLVILQPTGRVSGLQRQVPVVSTRLGNRVTVSTFRSDSQWLANIEAYPSVTVYLGGRPISGTARVNRGFLSLVEIVLDPSDDGSEPEADVVAAA
jgi:hypothetical protein